MTKSDELENPPQEREDRHDDPFLGLGYPEGLPTPLRPSEAAPVTRSSDCPRCGNVQVLDETPRHWHVERSDPDGYAPKVWPDDY